MSDLHKTIRSMITEQYQGIATTARGSAIGVQSRALGGSPNVGTSTGSITAPAAAALNQPPSTVDLLAAALLGNSEDQSGRAQNYTSSDTIKSGFAAAEAKLRAPKAVPTAPSRTHRGRARPGRSGRRGRNCPPSRSARRSKRRA